MKIRFYMSYRRVIAAILMLSLLMSWFVLPIHAEDPPLLAGESNAEGPGSEMYRLHYTSELWESVSESGVLFANDTNGILLDIQGRGAGFGATLLPYDGQTNCNALQIVIENRSACTELVLNATYIDDTNAATCIVRMQAHAERMVYYAYLDDVDKIDHVTLELRGVSDGEIVLYSFSRVSFYEQLTDAQTYGTIQECYYDAAAGNVVVQGRLHSDSVVDFFGGRIALYRLDIQQGAEAALNGTTRALQTVKVSNRFTFTVHVDTFVERNSRYVLVLISADGERVLLSESCFPVYRVSESQAKPVTPSYKGLYTDMQSLGGLTHPDAVIVDVYLDALTPESDALSVTYSYENIHYAFDSAYLNELEKQITPHLQIGREVYLRLCVRANSNGYQLPYTVFQPPVDFEPEHLAIRLDNAEAQQAFCATLNCVLGLFFSQRTPIAGVILGHSMDNSLQNYYAGVIPLQQYLKTVADAVVHTQNVLKRVYPDAIFYLPVSDTAYPSYYSSYDLDGVYATSMLLDGVGRMLEDMGRGDFVFHPLLEMNALPFALTQQQLQAAEGDDYTPIGLAEVAEALTPDLLMRSLYDYSSVSDRCAVLWTAPQNCEQLSWMLSYIYLYYSLQTEQVDTLFARLDSSMADEKLCELLARVDTVYASQATLFALSYFDVPSFTALIQQGKAGQNKQLRISTLTEEPRSAYTGRYSYWNFAAAIGTLQWTPSYGCESLTTDGRSRYGRALLAQMTTDAQGGEILYRFANPEDFSLCDALALTLAVTDSKGNLVPAQVCVTLYGENERIEAKGELLHDKMTTLTLGASTLTSAAECHAISIRVEAAGNEDEPFLNLYLFNVEGLSRMWDDATLQLRILEQRELRNAVQEEIPSFGVYPAMLLTALFLLTLAGALLALRASKKRKQNVAVATASRRFYR